MKMTKQERLKIGQEICEGKLTQKEAMAKYNISESHTSRCKLLYADENGLNRDTLPCDRPKKCGKTTKIYVQGKELTIDDYQKMTKEELINELILSKVNEARAKKGYEVKGDGQNRVYSSINNKTSK